MPDELNPSFGGGQLGGSLADLVSNVKNCVTNISALNTSVQSATVAIQSATLTLQTTLQSTSLALTTAVFNVATAIISSFPRINGSFTFSAATTTVVSQGSIAANSIVVPFATNATAALIVRSNGLFHLSNQPTTSFTMSTQVNSAPSGGTFNYIVINPS